MKEPLVSIIIIFYNEEKFIRDAIECAIKQDYRNTEIILVDDNSSDQSLQVCNNFSDCRIKIVNKGPLDKGEACSRNLGVANARGEYIIFLDGDDTMETDRVSKQLEFLSKGVQNSVVGCWVELRGLSKGYLKTPLKHQEIVGGFNREYKRVTMVGATLMCRRSILLKYPYRNKFKYFPDYDLLLRLYESTEVQFLNVPFPLYHYYIRKKGTKFQKDWFEYNLFLRDCKFRRRKGLQEFENPTEMYFNYKNKKFKRYILYKIFALALRIKIKLNFF